MPIRIETPRLLLRDHTAADLPSHHALLRDSRAMYYLPDLETRTLAQSQANLLFSMAEIDQSDRVHVFLRIETQAGEHVGEMGYTVTDITENGKIADMGYFTRPACWGRGYATEAARALIAYAFARGGVARLRAGCCADNRASERVMIKCGMTRDAYLPAHTRLRGQIRDRVTYYIDNPRGRARQ